MKYSATGPSAPACAEPECGRRCASARRKCRRAGCRAFPPRRRPRTPRAAGPCGRSGRSRWLSTTAHQLRERHQRAVGGAQRELEQLVQLAPGARRAAPRAPAPRTCCGRRAAGSRPRRQRPCACVSTTSRARTPSSAALAWSTRSSMRGAASSTVSSMPTTSGRGGEGGAHPLGGADAPRLVGPVDLRHDRRQHRGPGRHLDHLHLGVPALADRSPAPGARPARSRGSCGSRCALVHQVHLQVALLGLRCAGSTGAPGR